jgi:hypothetical protein
MHSELVIIGKVERQRRDLAITQQQDKLRAR